MGESREEYGYSVLYPERATFEQTLENAADASCDFMVIATAALPIANIKSCFKNAVRVLKDGGVLFVQGCPEYLPELGVYLDEHLNFKYWIAVEAAPRKREHGLPTVHAAVLLFTKGNGRFNIKRTRFPHQHCAFCERKLKDWGGKAHLMHPDGYVISDVWLDLPNEDSYTHISAPVLNAILRMLDFKREGVKGIVGPREGIGKVGKVAERTAQYILPGFQKPQIEYPAIINDTENEMYNVVHHGDALEVLKRYADNSIDLVFADPPYNLDKAYNVYDDERKDEQYIGWCNAWLAEYARVLKPSGSLYVLNLPHWAMYHAAFLNQHLHFQNWIVWNAMSEPRGKLMPAHYSLLFYTKHPTDFTFNYDAVSELDARYYCLRASCIRKRKAAGADDKMQLNDIWWNIHRIKHRRNRDYHPCQLPDALMKRIILLSSNEGDIVLDAFSGTGTTAVTAVKLGRRYVAIDLDEEYVRITRDKIAEVKSKGYIKRQSIRKKQRKYTKKELQLELRDIAAQLGRLPTQDDVREMSDYELNAFLNTFPTWGKALKAAKLAI